MKDHFENLSLPTREGGREHHPGKDRTGGAGDCARSIFKVMALLVADFPRRSEMGQAARRYVESRSFEAALDETWEMFGALNAGRMAAAG